jgi:hypothetical protein
MKENVYNVVKGCALCLKNVWMLLFVCLLLQYFGNFLVNN